MTDNSNSSDELSMEEILSSIKGILSETDKPSQPAQPAPQAEAAKPNNAEEDVFDLSASMVVDNPSPDAPVAADHAVSVEPVELPATEPLQTIAEQLQAQIEPEPEDEPEPEADSAKLDDAAIKTADFSILSDTEDDSVGEAAPVNVYDDADPDVVPEMDINNLPAMDNDASTPADEDVLGLDNISAIDVDDIDVDSAATGPHAPEPLSVKVDPYPAVEAETSAMPDIKDDTPSAEPADVSEAIIDNFAQMFNANKPSAPTSAAVAPSSEATLIGAEAKTVADLVKEVLRASLQPVVEQKLQNIDADILQALHAEVKAQAKAWVDANLNRVVEYAVKEEIKRVIAKVGS